MSRRWTSPKHRRSRASSDDFARDFSVIEDECSSITQKSKYFQLTEYIEYNLHIFNRTIRRARYRDLS